MIQLTNKVWAVKVPEFTNGFDVKYGHLWFYEGEPSFGSIKTIPLPGTWRFLCTSKDITEEQAAQIVKRSYLTVSLTYVDYGIDSSNYLSAIRSLNSLLASKGLDVNKNYCLIEKM